MGPTEVLRCVNVSVVMSRALAARPVSHVQGLFAVDVAALRTPLAGREPLVGNHERSPMPLALVSQATDHPAKAGSPTGPSQTLPNTIEPMDAAQSPEAPRPHRRSVQGGWETLVACASLAILPGCAAPAHRQCWGLGAAALGLLLGAAALLTETMQHDASVQLRRSTAYVSAPRERGATDFARRVARQVLSVSVRHPHIDSVVVRYTASCPDRSERARDRWRGTSTFDAAAARAHATVAAYRRSLPFRAPFVTGYAPCP